MKPGGFFSKSKNLIKLPGACAILLVVGVANLYAEAHPVPVDDLTASLIVEAATLDQDSAGHTELAITIRNSGTKPVSGYKISFGEVSVTQEFYPPSKGFNPGDTIQKIIPVAVIPDASGFDPTSGRPYFRLVAAVFSDGSAEGEQGAIETIKAMKKGRATQLDRIIPMLESVIALDPANQPEALHAVIEKVDTLPDVIEGSQEPGDFQSGMNDARETVVRELRAIEAGQKAQINQRLAALKSRQSTVLAAQKYQLGSDTRQ